MKNLKIALYIMISLSFISCKKFLEEKSDQRLLTPVALDQLQAILDNYNTMNTNYCSAAEVSADNYYLKDEDYLSLAYDRDRWIYRWEGHHLFAPANEGNDWGWTYQAVYAANTVLERLQNIPRTPANFAQWNDLCGQALIFRASRILDAAGIWSNAYNPETAGAALGLPLPRTTDFNLKLTRASLRETFDQILDDLRKGTAVAVRNPTSTFRPGKAAGYALLARTYLYMSDYLQAQKYADSCLQIKGALMDFNQLESSAEYPITLNNPETIYSTLLSTAYPLLFNTPKIEPSLLSSYEDNDLRRSIFFSDNGDGTFSFKGNYTGDYSLLCGPAVDEMYLIRAEAAIRTDHVHDGVNDLNTLLSTRYRTGTYISLATTSREAALSRVLEERRKELVMRGIRWADIKRLNQTGAAISLKRNIEGVNYTLVPLSPRFTLPIPEDVISTSGMVQNPQ